jgi:hypothetical protein
VATILSSSASAASKVSGWTEGLDVEEGSAIGKREGDGRDERSCAVDKAK